MNTKFLDYKIEDSETFIKEIKKEVEKPWFCSSDFCLFYLYPPMEGFSRWEDESGNIIQQCYYHESKILGFYKIINVYSSRPINIDLIVELIQKKGGRMGRIRLLYRDDLPEAIANDPKTLIRRESEDMIIDLPNTLDDYIKSLGSNARRHARHRGEKLWKQFNGRIEKEIIHDNEIDFKVVDKIIELSKTRMQKKDRPFLWNIEGTEQRKQLAKKCGLLVTIKIDNQIVAGTLTCVYENNNQAYIFLNGSDMAYDKYDLGEVCFLETIKEMISLEIKSLHFLWGESFYKKELGAKKNDLFEIYLPRSNFDKIVWPLLRTITLIIISRHYWFHLLIKDPSSFLLLIQNLMKKNSLFFATRP